MFGLLRPVIALSAAPHGIRPSMPLRLSSSATTAAPSASRPTQGLSTEQAILTEHEYAAHNYHPLPVVLSRGQGVHVWDPEGRHYYDFLSAYSAVNQGHCHPKIIEALTTQAQRITLTSRAFYSDVFPRFAQYITEFFDYEMVLPMNTGAEGFETAVKLSKRWGYDVKGIPDNQAIIVGCVDSFHGRTAAAVAMSTDPSARDGFGPFLSGMLQVPFGDFEALRTVFEAQGPRIAAFVLEPIQGEAGIVVPPPGYLSSVQALCKKHNILLVCDEIQSGLCRTGRMLDQHWEGVKADMTILGKALSGGTIPVSAVLGSKEIMLTIKAGQHGSTYGGNPLASAVGIAALQVLKDEGLAERSDVLGRRLISRLLADAPSGLVETVRGRGLMVALVIRPDASVSAMEVCLRLRDAGLLAKPTHGHIIRLAPPLVITEAQIDECADIMLRTLHECDALQNQARDRLEVALKAAASNSMASSRTMSMAK